MRFWIFLAIVGGIGAGLLAWFASVHSPFPELRFTLAESTLIGIGIFISIIAVAALIRSERGRHRQIRTIEGLERFESDLARRLGAIEARLRSFDQPETGNDTATRFTRTAELVKKENKSHRSIEPAGGAGSLKGLRSHDPNSRALRQRIVAAVTSGEFANWYQPIVSLPERVTQCLDATVYVAQAEERALPEPEWSEIARRAGIAGQVHVQSVIDAVKLAREMSRSEKPCDVMVRLPAAAMTEPQTVRAIDRILRSNSGMGPRIVLKIPAADLSEIGIAGNDCLDACLRSGYRLALAECRNLKEAESAISGGLFSFLLLDAGVLLARDPAVDASALARIRRQQTDSGIRLVATGIQAEETAIELIDHDILLAQGPLFSPARPLRERNAGFELSEHSTVPGALR